MRLGTADPLEVPEDAQAPEWPDSHWIWGSHWTHYATTQIRDFWKEFTPEQREAIAVVLNRCASDFMDKRQ